jgi:hypothetical protein
MDEEAIRKPWVVVTTYNHHVRLLSPGPLVGWHRQSLLGHWSRHCDGINFTNYTAPPEVAGLGQILN